VRGGAVNEATIDHWYTLLQETINKYKIERDLIFAMDETCCFLDKCTHKTRHIGPHGLQQWLTLRNENRETATLITLLPSTSQDYARFTLYILMFNQWSDCSKRSRHSQSERVG